MRVDRSLSRLRGPTQCNEADSEPLIAIVDDDPSVLKALARLLRAHALTTSTFTSARAFLASLSAGHPECLERIRSSAWMR